MAGEILEVVSQDEKARAKYQQREKWYLDKVSSEKFLLNKGREEGREEGREQELLNTVKILLNKKFKELPEDLSVKIEKANITQLEKIREDIFDIESVDDLKKYL